ncbi:putative START domain-containing protein [Helianthus anomalus]
MLPAGNGGTIELVYTHVYAPTTVAPARDFWTLRYTTSLENGSLMVCERSLSGSGGGPNVATAAQFIRGEMLPKSSGEAVYGIGRQPAILRTLSQRLSRGFNDAINGFNDDGWSLMNCAGAEDMIVSINLTKNISN